MIPFSSARATLPSFMYPIHCLRPFPPPCGQPCLNLVFNRQRFELVDVGLMGEGREESCGEYMRLLVYQLSCIKGFRCGMQLSVIKRNNQIVSVRERFVIASTCQDPVYIRYMRWSPCCVSFQSIFQHLRTLRIMCLTRHKFPVKPLL